MNKAILMGRLARDPEMRQTQSGTAVCRLTIAVDRRFSKDGQRTADFISCTAWRQTAEFICKYFHKGSMIAVVGNIQTRSWDGADGKKQYATEVVIDEAYFTGAKSETQTTAPSAQPKGDGFAPPMWDEFEPEEGNEEDLPF